MKRLKRIWSQVLGWENLLSAYGKAKRGKGDRDEVAHFSLNLEQELNTLREDLAAHRYRPGEYRQFEIYDRKPRLISAAPFRDRVLQHALMNVVEPKLDKGFIDDCYACRRGKGVHRAVDRYQQWCRRYPYVLKTDIARYFPSIDHDLLKAKLARRIGDPDVLWLFGRIIDSAPAFPEPHQLFPGDDLVTLMVRRTGMPIGNLTSQFFGNLYLDGLDHYVKQELRAKAYLRYVDDILVLGDDKACLWDMAHRIERFLENERLRLHPVKVEVMPTDAGVGVFGYHVWPHKRRLRTDNARRFARRMRQWSKAYRQGRMSLADIRPRLASWIGHAEYGDTLGLRRKILSQVVFSKGEVRGVETDDRARGSRRWLEQQTGERSLGQP
jgi:hypothetical protein